MRILNWIAALLVMAAVISFAVSNRQAVSIALWPLTDWSEGVVVPAYLAVLAPFAVGWAGGWLWGAVRGWRRRRAGDKPESVT